MYEQVAETLHVSVSTTKRHMTRAQSLLREALTHAGYREAALRGRPTPATAELAHRQVTALRRQLALPEVRDQAHKQPDRVAT